MYQSETEKKPIYLIDENEDRTDSFKPEHEKMLLAESVEATHSTTKAFVQAEELDSWKKNGSENIRPHAEPRAKIPPNELPVTCKVSTRLPTFYSSEPSIPIRLLLYSQSSLSQFHLVLVFGNDFRSKSLISACQNASLQDKIKLGCSRNFDTELTNGDKSRDQHDDTKFTANGHAAADCRESHREMKRMDPLVRIHSSCFTGETLGSLRCDCAEQLHNSIRILSENGGILVYLNQEGRGIGLLSKLYAYNLIDNGLDTYTANIELGFQGDERDYKIACQILADLSVTRVRLLTNNVDKIEGLNKGGIKVVERVPLIPKDWIQGGAKNEELKMTNSNSNGSHSSSDRDDYLITKIKKMGHLITVPSFIENILSNPVSK